MKNKFEEFLMDEHAKDYRGNGDDIGIAFDEWLGCLDIDKWLIYGEMFGNKIKKELTDTLDIYSCKYCGKYHLGHRKVGA